MIYEVDLAGVCCPSEFHQRIRDALPVPEWYGNNLDALRDILTEQGDWDVRFCHAGDLRNARPEYTALLVNICRECGARIAD